jgi:hypothetical protein
MARGYTPASSAPERFQTWAREPQLLALPFGDASKVLTGGDDIYPVWFYAAWPALAAMVAMLLAAGARNLYERHRRSAPPTAA